MRNLRLVENKFFMALFLFLLVFLTKLPTMGIDYDWDSLVVASQSKYYTQHSLLSIPPGIVVHTPFIPWSMSVLYRVFGESPFLSNLIIALFSFLGAYFIYLIGRRTYNSFVGFIASIMLFFSPMYFSLSGQLLYDVPLTAMTIITLYFFMTSNLKFYLVAASILVLIKEPGFLAIIAIIFYSILKKQSLKRLLVLASPLILVVVWGTFLLPNIEKIGIGGYLAETSSLSLVLQKLAAIIYQVGIWNYSWVLLIIIFYLVKADYISYRKNIYRRFVDHDLCPLFIISILYFTFFSLPPIFFLSRYTLPIVPLFIILGAVSINKIKSKKLIVLLVIILFISTYRFNWGIKGAIQDPIFQGLLSDNPISSIRSSELSLDYIDIVSVQGNALDYIFLHQKNTTILATYPLVEDSSIYTNVGRRQWKKNGINVLNQPTPDNIDKADLIIVEAYGNFNKETLSKIRDRPILKSFKVNEKEIIIYSGV